MSQIIETITTKKKPPKHIADFDQKARKEFAIEQNLEGFRADQVSRHWFGNLSSNYEEWTDLPIEKRKEIAEKLTPELLTEVKTQKADQGNTVKTLWKLHDGLFIESVLMHYPNRTTVCISSQAGCGMACPFCATGQLGLKRNLSAAEIVSQVQYAARYSQNGLLPDGPTRLSNIVFMGMGEPLANFNTVVQSIKAIHEESPAGLGISARNITVSTVGLVPKIYELAELKLPVRLAVSLHAPNDELRNTLVPINERYSIKEVLNAVWNYAEVIGRRVSIEYAMIKNINDQKIHAQQLANLLKNKDVHVNLIPLNPTPGSKWTASKSEDEKAFVQILEQANIAVTVRDTRGREIDGACGQLAATV
ncbi:MAG: 23S rRNA (adenine(2503)-C(2))-methyltransferase RlmN [Actinomycetes bacterium]